MRGQWREGWAWRGATRRLSRVLPPAHAASTLGDLAEDFARRRAAVGAIRAHVWLLREARSLLRAYGALHPAPPIRRRAMLLDDVRQAWRRLVGRPAAPMLCAALLSLGIGLATAMFSVIDSLVLRPAPFPDADRLVEMGFWDVEPDVMDAWRASGMFQAVEAARAIRVRTSDSAAGTWPAALATPGIFEMLGVRATQGRVFTAADTQPGADDVVLLSETIWRSAFGSDPAILGRRIALDGVGVAVIGVLPASFRFPLPTTVLWRPFDPARAASTRAPGTRIYGRLHEGAPRADVEARTAAIAREFARLPANYSGTPPLRRVGRPDQLDDLTRRALWLLVGGVVAVFAVLCANVSSLLLVQLSDRRRELAVCAALGASRARLLRQTAVEHALIAAGGALPGVALAWMLTAIVPALFLDRTLNPIDIDPRALGAAALLGMTTVVLSGLMPAWLGTRSDPTDAVRGSRHGGTDTRPARVATRVLLVSEVALACALLVGSALLARSFANLVNADRGLSMDDVVHVDVGGIEEAFFTSREANALGTAAIEAQIATWPEVETFALARATPPTWDTGLVQLGPPLPVLPRPGATATEADLDAWATTIRSRGTSSDMYRVSPSFFDVYRIRILRGRALAPTDSALDAVIGERLARILWPDADPIDRSFTVGRTAGYRVVGVASELRLPTIDRELDRPELYLPLGDRSGDLTIGLRCRASCPDVATMQSRLRQVHPALRARVLTDTETTYLAQLRLPRAIAQVGGVFAAAAVLTAAGGLFSVMTYAVRRRRREFGIRTALGASPRHLRRLVFRHGFTLVAAGVIAGTAGAWLVARALAAFQYGATPADPVVWMTVLGTIGVTSLAAFWRPARQAMRVDPVTLLREE